MQNLEEIFINNVVKNVIKSARMCYITNIINDKISFEGIPII